MHTKDDSCASADRPTDSSLVILGFGIDPPFVEGFESGIHQRGRCVMPPVARLLGHLFAPVGGLVLSSEIRLHAGALLLRLPSTNRVQPPELGLFRLRLLGLGLGGRLDSLECTTLVFVLNFT